MKRYYMTPYDYASPTYLVLASDYDTACAERDRAMTALGEMSESYVHDTKALAARVERLEGALRDILEWCENAKRAVGVEPYGLAVARAALSPQAEKEPAP